MRPLIGVTCSFDPTGAAPPRPRNYLNAAYSDAIYAAGGIPFPLALPPEPDAALIAELLERCDGLLFTGGPDVDPRRYGQSPHARTQTMDPRRDAFELPLFAATDRSGKPVLSICLGCQVTAVCRGGQLVQHVDDLPRAATIEHHKSDHTAAYHPVRVERDSLLWRIVGRTEFEVNSRHHQVVDARDLGGGLRAVAFAPDGVVEAVEDAGRPFMIAVQWHPEDLIDRPEHLRLFEALVAAAAQRR